MPIRLGFNTGGTRQLPTGLEGQGSVYEPFAYGLESVGNTIADYFKQKKEEDSARDAERKSAVAGAKALNSYIKAREKRGFEDLEEDMFFKNLSSTMSRVDELPTEGILSVINEASSAMQGWSQGKKDNEDFLKIKNAVLEEGSQLFNQLEGLNLSTPNKIPGVSEVIDGFKTEFNNTNGPDLRNIRDLSMQGRMILGRQAQINQIQAQREKEIQDLRSRTWLNKTLGPKDADRSITIEFMSPEDRELADLRIAPLFTFLDIADQMQAISDLMKASGLWHRSRRFDLLGLEAENLNIFSDRSSMAQATYKSLSLQIIQAIRSMVGDSGQMSETERRVFRNFLTGIDPTDIESNLSAVDTSIQKARHMAYAAFAEAATGRGSEAIYDIKWVDSDGDGYVDDFIETPAKEISEDMMKRMKPLRLTVDAEEAIENELRKQNFYVLEENKTAPRYMSDIIGDLNIKGKDYKVLDAVKVGEGTEKERREWAYGIESRNNPDKIIKVDQSDHVGPYGPRPGLMDIIHNISNNPVVAAASLYGGFRLAGWAAKGIKSLLKPGLFVRKNKDRIKKAVGFTPSSKDVRDPGFYRKYAQKEMNDGLRSQAEGIARDIEIRNIIKDANISRISKFISRSRYKRNANKFLIDQDHIKNEALILERFGNIYSSPSGKKRLKDLYNTRDASIKKMNDLLKGKYFNKELYDAYNGKLNKAVNEIKEITEEYPLRLNNLKKRASQHASMVEKYLKGVNKEDKVLYKRWVHSILESVGRGGAHSDPISRM